MIAPLLRATFPAGLAALTLCSAGVVQAQPAPAAPAGDYKPAPDDYPPPPVDPVPPPVEVVPPPVEVVPPPVEVVSPPVEPIDPRCVEIPGYCEPVPPRPTSALLMPAVDNDRFTFGSYGRVSAGTDLRGGKPEAVDVVGIGPRIVEPSYLELDLGYRHYLPRGGELRTHVTLAFDDTLFHATGDFDAQPAIRNLFVEGDVTRSLTAWVGSRMYRGRDIYLLDYWPLEDQNTVGGGAGLHRGKLDVRAHVGWNRLADEFMYQTIEVPDPAQGATTVTQLNRQRMVASTTAAWRLLTASDTTDQSAEVKVHGELHRLAAGERERDDGTREALPADSGFTLGAELAVWDVRVNGIPDELAPTTHASLFARYSRGLAAFDELAPPTSFDASLTTGGASEFVLGAAANFDHPWFSVSGGYLARRTIDADGDTTDVDDAWEHTVAVRPLVSLGDPPHQTGLFLGADLSYQVRFPHGPSTTTGLISDPAVLQLAPMLVWSPRGQSAYARPQLRLVYRAAHQNQGARDAYVPDDPRGDETWMHYLGLQAEWWFGNSTTGGGAS